MEVCAYLCVCILCVPTHHCNSHFQSWLQSAEVCRCHSDGDFSVLVRMRRFPFPLHSFPLLLSLPHFFTISLSFHSFVSFPFSPFDFCCISISLPSLLSLPHFFTFLLFIPRFFVLFFSSLPLPILRLLYPLKFIPHPPPHDNPDPF